MNAFLGLIIVAFTYGDESYTDIFYFDKVKKCLPFYFSGVCIMRLFYIINIQVHLNKLECRGKVNFSNSTQIVKLVY